MSKICLNCGNEVEDTAHFCNICGTEMNEQTCASNTPPEPELAPPTRADLSVVRQNRANRLEILPVLRYSTAKRVAETAGG